MKNSVSVVAILGHCAWWATAALAQTTQPTTQPAQAPKAEAPAAEIPTAELPEGVAATVDGQPIMQGEVDEVLAAIVQQRFSGQPLPPQVIAQARERLKPQILKGLVDDRLLDSDVQRAQITISDQEMMAEAQSGLHVYLLRSGMTQPEFEERLQAEQGVKLAEFLNQRATDPQFKQFNLHVRLLEERFPQEFTISDQEVKKQYEADLESVYSKPQMVRASHILIPVTPNMSEEERLAARQQADQVLIEVKQPGADFAALAAQHSKCPSNARGGDLGYFPREGAVVEPFAVASFESGPGVVGEVVETQFGFHIIMVTGKKEPNVVTLAQAKDAIFNQLKAQKMGEIREQHTTALRKNATIVYSK